MRHKRKRSSAPTSHRAPVGAVPGTFRIDPNAPRPVIDVMAYGPDDFVAEEIRDLTHLEELLAAWPVVWVNVCGLGDEKVLNRLKDLFGLHPLALADVVNVSQRSKVEPYGDLLFVVTRMATVQEHKLDTEQMSIFLGRRFVLTFQEHVGDCLEPVRDRIRHNAGRIRNLGTDYLAYSLLDAVIDAYYPLLEQYGEWLEDLEDQVISHPDVNTVHRVRGARRDLLTLRRALWPQRDAVNALLRDPLPQVADETRIYLRDCYDHVSQLIDIIETQRELAAGLQDVYLSTVSNRMNEVMKVLTVIATIFIPLTFIVGIYGMNFDPDRSPWNMPELRWAWGYPAVLAVMATVAAGMLVYFRRRGWLGGGRRPRGDDEPPAGP
ncbi:MAG: magnesium/cobalt transporter CorA [Planctomycetes bacterium]|nr:magnesium/cobalt transporter CorA [Planctomycetota bacterium]